MKTTMKTASHTAPDIAGASLSKQDALNIERDAKKHLDGFTANGFALAVDLRKLQDGGAHLLRGYPNFGDYIEAKFGGHITATNARRLSHTGKVIIALEETDRVTLATGAHRAVHKVLGTTGARALSVVQTKHGTEQMLAVYDTAAQVAKDRGTVITDEIVAALLKPQLPEPPPQPPEVEDAAWGEPEPDRRLTPAERELVQIIQNVDEDCMTLEDLITHRGAGAELADAYASSIAEQAARLLKALKAAVTPGEVE